eukprot:987729_1
MDSVKKDDWGLQPGLDVLAAATRLEVIQGGPGYEIKNENDVVILKAGGEFDCGRCLHCDCILWRNISDPSETKLFMLDKHCQGTCCLCFCIPMVGCLMEAEVKNMDGSVIGHVRQRRVVGMIFDFEDVTGQTVFKLCAPVKCLCGSERFPILRNGVEITAIESVVPGCGKATLKVDFPSDMAPQNRLLLLVGLLLLSSILYEDE